MNAKITKEQIVQVALNHLMDYGYARTSIHDIATLCGIKKTSIYQHINNKDELALLALDFKLKAVKNKINKILADPAIENRVAEVTLFYKLVANEINHFQSLKMETVSKQLLQDKLDEYFHTIRELVLIMVKHYINYPAQLNMILYPLLSVLSAPLLNLILHGP
ncbi:MAG: TetR/AcrR family transcriptional regulator [Legionellales bacterium]|nr:TetR/AcrR family transcriptional regulator [Legionellales bacterium]